MMAKKEAETKTETEAETEAKAETKAKTETKTKAKAKAETKAKGKAKAETKAKGKAKAETKAKGKAKAKAEKKSEAKTMGKEEIIEAVKQMSVLDLADLVKTLEDEFGVSAAAPVAMAAMPGAVLGATAAEEEEKTEWDVVLKEVGPKKIQVIKAVRSLRADLGLREAKELVDGAPAPILEAATKDAAEEAKGKLEAEGAIVEVK